MVLFSGLDAGASDLRRVISPVADLRSETQDAPPDTYAHDPLEESQLLFGEIVKIHQTDGDWGLAEAVNQREFTHKKVWEGYPGWVRLENLGEPWAGPVESKAVVKTFWANVYDRPLTGFGRSQIYAQIPFGSFIDVVRTAGDWAEMAWKCRTTAWMRKKYLTCAAASIAMPESDTGHYDARIADCVWKHMRLFFGVPYYWGGLSPYGTRYRRVMTGVDCSGLVHLAYRAAGAVIPRDSHEQWMSSAPLKREELRRGDLVFLANAEKPQKIVHVAMYVGGEFLIEGPGTGLKVRRITFKKKFGRRLSGIESGDTVGGKVIYFGRPEWTAISERGEEVK